MEQTPKTPTFNMKVVVQETGLKPDTLRAWERRYNLPQPERTEGGHRLYSQRDIDTLKWLIARQEEGLSISHAVELWNRIESQGQDPLLVESATVQTLEAPTSLSISSGETLTELRQAWISACMRFDESRADAVLGEAFAMYQPEKVIFDVLRQGLYEIGENWYAGKTTVQQEHFASELAIRRLEALVAATAQPTRSRRIVVGCPTGEEHTFSPLLQTFLLRRRGWEVVYLGANVPVERLETTLDVIKPQLVIFAAQLLVTAASILVVAEMLQKRRVQFAFGGRIFTKIPEIRGRIPGHYLGDTLEATVKSVEKILTMPKPLSEAEPVSERYNQALIHFQECRAAIDSAVWDRLRSQGFPYSTILTANEFLAGNIVAALKLGDINYLSPEIEWIGGLLQNRDDEIELLPAYLQAYRDSVAVNLDERGQTILEWFNQMVA